MLGDFQYYISESEESESDCDSDSSLKSGDSLDFLTSEKKLLEEKILSYEKKLKNIQKTLKTLNGERKTLLTKRNELISSACSEQESNTVNNTNTVCTIATNEVSVSSNSPIFLPESTESLPNVQPLNLNIPNFQSLNDGGDAEEFDTDEES